MNNQKLSACLDRLEDVFNQVARRLHAELDHHLLEGLTGNQFWVLKRILRRGRMSVSEAAEDMGVSLSAITALVDRLHRAGFVQRRRDEGDRRVVWLELTPRGEEVVRSCVAAKRRVMERYWGQLPEEDLEQLVCILEKLLVITSREGSPGGCH
ncbi:DNA-binding MarR family transcriptional regulator [Desulfofundulus luciae]|uniref:DNA-binding MarR family transcriptional regulator n=1 Tax=Desulfofundulus luciae TaxID=74702 RepID=A0ABU0AX53_9FIRM|nr:MarR family transcriptional regulator [Desulfofundulus luciae]MDQ0285073.1 DNA-binding MarR family transcriptional regulator [Desulfofundulus luciae]